MPLTKLWVDAQLMTRARAELSDERYELRQFDAMSPPRRGIVILTGAQRADELANRFIRVAVLAVVVESELATPVNSVADLLIEGWATGELAARVARLAAQDAPGYQVHLLARAIRYAGDIVELGTPDAVLQYVNPAYKRVLGFSPSEVEGKTPAQLVRSKAHSKEFFQEIDQQLCRGEAWSGRIISQTAEGQEVYLETTIAPVMDRNNEVTHHIAVKRDITERVHKENALKETNLALRRARDAAVQANRAKSEFLANMSHELRTPLNAIIGYGELLIEDAEEAGDMALVKDLRKIRSSGAHLLNLINDVLDMSKVESGRMELHMAEFTVREVVDSVLSAIKPLAKKHNNKLQLDISPTLSPIVSDRQKLSQILSNLLSNACKFTKDGKVHLSAHVNEDSHLVVRVEDTGIGMSEQQCAKVFQPFVQADSSTTRRYGGTGLGLAISHRFCELLGGRIEVASTPQAGSIFTLILPTNFRRPSLQVAAPRGFGTGTVLVIDDDQATYELLGRTLAQRGYRVEWAATGDAGLLAARTHVPDAIVLDVAMPGLGGWSVLTSLKEDPETSAIPVVTVTSLDQKDLGISLGASDYVIKPVLPATLLATLVRWLPRSEDARHVLVVEDDPDMQDILERTLQGAGYEVTCADNGRIGLEKLHKISPDAVILDLMMPEMDGFEFLSAVQKNPLHAHVPIIVATAKELTESERAMLLGMGRDVILKSAQSRQSLLRMVERRVSELVQPPAPVDS